MGIYKLIALDMDGTLLNEDKQISAENRKWLGIAAEQGITVILATGRRIQSVLPYVEQLKWNSPIITANGGEIWKTPSELLQRNPLPAPLIVQLKQIADDLKTWCWGYTTEHMYNQDHWAEEQEGHTWLKFGYYSEQPGVLLRVREKLAALGSLEITNSHACNLEINPLGIHKASGIQAVCQLLGIDMSQVVAMGDSLNDVSMIRAVGLGVAMGNAQAEVKSSADLVTLINEEDGVAHVIQNYVL